MGSFYVSHTLKTSDQQLVMDVLRKQGRTAAVSLPQDGIIIVLDEKCDGQDTQEVEHLTSVLSASTNSSVLAVLNHDDDILMYWLARSGEVLDRYNSFPGYFDDELAEARESPEGGDAGRLAHAFWRADCGPALEAILRAEQDEFVFAVDRHRRVCELLGLRWPNSSMGYRYFRAGGDSSVISQFRRIGLQ